MLIEPRPCLKSDAQKKAARAKDRSHKNAILVFHPQKIGGNSRKDHRQDLKNTIRFHVAFNSPSASSIIVFDRFCLLKKYLITKTKGTPINIANGSAATIKVTRPNMKF